MAMFMRIITVIVGFFLVINQRDFLHYYVVGRGILYLS